MPISLFLCLPLTLPVSPVEGIRCYAMGSRVNVSRSQWEKVRSAILSHDPKRIGSYLSSHGLLETRITRREFSKPVIASRLVGGQQFLSNLTQIKFDDKSYVFSPLEPKAQIDLVFAYFWSSLTPANLTDGGKSVIKRPKSIQIRSDVWASRNIGGEGRVRFVCEDGWLKVAEIKTTVPVDP